MKPLKLLLIFSICVFVISCAIRKPLKETREGMDITLPTLMDRLSHIREIKGSALVDLRMSGGSMSGDASIMVRPESFDVKIYSMGFPAGEIKMQNGVFESSHQLRKEEEIIIVKCLKEGIFWWNATDINITSTDCLFYLKRPGQVIALDKKTLKPIEQVIALPGGERLRITYKEAQKIEGIWFPAKIQATSAKYSLTIEFDKIDIIMN